MIRGDSFTCDTTGFTVNKPTAWEFMPGPWMAPARAKIRAPSEDGQQLLTRALDPIIVFRLLDPTQRELNPIAQLFRKHLPAPISLAEVEALTRDAVPRVLHECELLELSSDAMLAGVRSLRYHAEYTAVSEREDGTLVSCRVRCVSHVILLQPFSLTLSVSTPTEKHLRADADVNAIFGSARF